MPASTVQYIATEMCNIHCEGQEILEKRLERKLVAEGVSPDLVENILASISKEDPFVQSSNKLKSNFRRKKFYKKNFDYVEPVSLLLTESHGKNAKYFQYVPILKTVEHFFRDKSFQEELLKDPKPREDEVLRDFTDGNVYKKNAFFKKNINGLRIILYEDAFEIVNPIGAAKTKHKVIAVYLSLGNLPDNVRSHINNIKLVALCTEKLFDYKKVYGKIVTDLIKLEEEGI